MENSVQPQAPPGYIFRQALFEDWSNNRKWPFWLFLLMANFVALLPLAVGILLLWLPYQVYRMMGTPYAIAPDLTLPLFGTILIGATLFFASMLLHEWLHGVALSLMGYKPRYAFHKLYLTASIEQSTYLPRRNYLIMTLTPLLVLSFVGGLILLFMPPAIAQLWLVALLINCAASIGDLMVAYRVFRAPTNAVFTDENGIQLFVPQE